jgi:hypothetical protein
VSSESFSKRWQQLERVQHGPLLAQPPQTLQLSAGAPTWGRANQGLDPALFVWGCTEAW